MGEMTHEKLNEKDIIYMVLTDRFYEDDEAKKVRENEEWRKAHPEYNPELLKFYNGGTWKGLMEKLDYIQSLGVTAIWISPVSKNEIFNTTGNAIIAEKLNNPEYDGTGDNGDAWKKATSEAETELKTNPDVETGFHGYFTKDYDEPNEMFGTKEDLEKLAKAIHKRGMKLVLDVVPNHTADYYIRGKEELRFPNLHAEGVFNNPDFYHHNGMIDANDWNTCLTEQGQKNIEVKDLGGLDDLAQEKPEVRKAIIASYKKWMEVTKADGLRVDAARCMPKDFLAEFEKEMQVPTFGEVFEFNSGYVASFQKKDENDQKGMWGCLDFPLFMAMREVFAQNGNVERLATVFGDDKFYADPNHLVTFLDNHDRDRFLCVAKDDYQKLRLALTFMFMCRGIPQIYYGTEQALYGGDSPSEGFGIANKFNREMMPLKSFEPFSGTGERELELAVSKTPEIYKYIKKLTEIRKAYKCLQSGIQYEMWVDTMLHNVFAFTRIKDAEEIITVVNKGEVEQTLEIPIREESKLEVGDELKNLINTNKNVTVKVENGGVTGKQIKLVIPEKTVYAFVISEAYKDFHFDELKILKTVVRVHCDKEISWLNIKGYPYPLFGDIEHPMKKVAQDIWEFETERFEKGQEFTFKLHTNEGNGDIWSAETFKGNGEETIDVTPSMLHTYKDIL